MFSHIQKWGNSLGVRIPAQLAKKLNLHAGSSVILEIEKGRLVVQTPKYDLDMMLSAITPQNRHHLALEDTQTGKEEW
ncbi:MAG: AbrB/MazE/SpoVT family DNA-binding domain-containing protein [Verrucomicrobia bacterium]|nr:AbrB/MazE/SpoVT family DNA-binding domain-containing protein [Verrucomicrobiota bacterium]MBS0637813.1 AbrB/MazE/SpoVT family DNA-binding domain-containing protein [Verrucomicrobiota bacterium]